MKNFRFLWLDGIFDEKTVQLFPSTSPAAVFWQRGFVESLQNHGHDVELMGYPVERVWPFGKLWVKSASSRLAPGLKGTIISYLNFPFIRGQLQYFQFLRAVKRFFLRSDELPDYVVTFSCLHSPNHVQPSNRMAEKIQKDWNIPWICIVSDGVAPPGADAYVYVTWSYYDARTLTPPSIHMDGGVPDIKIFEETQKDQKQKALMYMGALTPHGGVSPLARAFHLLPDKDIQLWICGRGENVELEALAKIDERIKLIGFVSEIELDELASSATAFANPRPVSFEPNKLNYPSKILHYLGYGKPIISTFTEGVSPEYADVLLPISDDNEENLGLSIKNVLNMDKDEYSELCARISKFNETHTWKFQISRFLTWLQDEV
jgi:glycosyltransferase involved in cell wall biosynthesis